MKNQEDYLRQVCMNCSSLKNGILKTDPKYKCQFRRIEIHNPKAETCGAFTQDYTKIKTQ